jgi:hypothetical protein
MKYAFMAQHHSMWPLAVLCEVFDVSRSGFYAYVQRQAAPPIERDEVALLARVKAIHAETRQSYGSRRMAKQLQADGFTVGRYKARRVMRQAGIAVRRPRQRPPMTTDSGTATQSPRPCSRASLMSHSRTRSGREILRISGRPKAGCTWPCSWTCIRGK